MRVFPVLPEPVCRAGDLLGEGPAWDPVTGALLWVDVLRCRVYRHVPHTGETSFREFGHAVSAVLPRAGGGLIVAARPGLMLLDAAGVPERTVEVPGEPAGNRLGDAGVDPAGRLWFGTLDADMLPGRGGLHRIAPGAAAPERILDRTSVANGIGWSPDGTRMYFVDSATRRVDVFDYDPATGTASGRRAWVTVEDEAGVPDGLAVDAEGGVWVALWRGGQVRRYREDGGHDATVPLPVRQVTSCAFGGPELDRLYITTGRVEMDRRRLAAEPEAGAVFAADVGVRGVPVPPYAG
ncbi:SMP-30/gluconolactonase/LRE family protein [Microbispora sp. NBC_01189]|uniref:SMP-30/gluconolactonase/LRE family protein n=1 Tax=Microbispora sp. NBC_01189 TaxID=2903583 RepID=UPI002E0FFAF2|nr:SMP-30/gluconolactonase/LRE family protein [Microbispora sp. NBC_01189]